MVLSWTSDVVQVTNGGSTSIAIPSGIAITKIVGLFGGETTEGSASASISSGSANLTFPNPSGGIAYTTYSGSWKTTYWGPGSVYFYEWHTCGAGESWEYYNAGGFIYTGNVSGPGTVTRGSVVIQGGSVVMTGSYSATWTAKTKNPSFYLDDAGETSGYTGILNQDYWGTGTDYSGATTDLTVGASNTVHFVIGGSGQASFKLYIEFTYSRPTLVKTMKVQHDGSALTLPLVSPSDAALEYAFLRVQEDSTVYCVDVVATTDSEASPVRFMKNGVVYAIRKEV